MRKRRKNRAGGFFRKFLLTNESPELYDVLAINKNTGSIQQIRKVSSVEEALELKKKYLALNTQYYILEDSSVLVELQ